MFVANDILTAITELEKVKSDHQKRVQSLEESLKIGGGKKKKLPTLVNEDIPRIEKLIAEVEVVYQFALETLQQIPSYRLLPEDQLVVIRDTMWFEAVQNHAEFNTCLQEFPTMEENKFAREDLVLFATLVCEYEPMYKSVINSILQKREQMIQAAGLRKNRKEKEKVYSEAEIIEQQENSMLNEEEKHRAERAAKAEANRAKREKAWLRAHPHIFVSIPGEYAFCVECKERDYDAWLEDFREKEKAWMDSFSTNLIDTINEMRETLRDKVAHEYEILEKKRRLHRKLQLQTHLKNYKAQVQLLAQKNLTMDRDKLRSKIKQILKIIPPLPKPLENVEFPVSVSKEDMNRMTLNYRNYMLKQKKFRANEDEEEIQRKCFIPHYILRSGLSFVDCTGKVIIPEVLDIVIDPRTIPLEIDGNESDIDPDDERNHIDKRYPITGIKVRVWHRELDGSRGPFLGQVKINHEEMMEPSKGIRTYPLQLDTRCIREATAVNITGSLAVKVNSTKMNKKTGNPIA